MRLASTLVCCALLAAAPVWAGTAKKAVSGKHVATKDSGTDTPIEITADTSLEWYQNTRLYVARGRAKAVQGTVIIEADLLTAHARDKGDPHSSPEGKGLIDRVMGEGHVHITDLHQQIFGEHATYDLDRKVAQVTGEGLRYVTEKEVVTAKDSLEYYGAENVAVARGKAVAIQGKRHIEGDILTAHFKKDEGKQALGSTAASSLDQITAEGHVTVVTATDVAQGDHGVYNAVRDIATLTGHVRITRENTHLSGDRAEVDFAKGESRLLNQGSGRVRAILPQHTTPRSSPGTTKQ